MSCVARTLSQGGSISIEECSCGHLRLNVGPITLRMERASFELLVKLVTTARRSLDQAFTATASHDVH